MMTDEENVGWTASSFRCTQWPEIHTPTSCEGWIKNTTTTNTQLVNGETMANSEVHFSFYQIWIIDQTQQARKEIINFSALEPQI